MKSLTNLLGDNHVHVISFEFQYMAARRTGGTKRPPPPITRLIDEYRGALAHFADQRLPGQRTFIAGKSLGGRVASLIANEAHAAGLIAGAIAIGYPFHANSKPMQTDAAFRTAHLATMTCPMLIVQGERDPFGSQLEIEQLTLSPAVEVAFCRDGDHDLKPRKLAGVTHQDNLENAAQAIAAFCRR